HPRYYGTYPRILGHYAREKNIMTLEEVVKKSTLYPAKKLNIKDRGVLKEGNIADITIFDKDKVIDVATFDNPHQYPVGIEYVIVNGKIVIAKGEHTGQLPGIVLKHKINQ
ncbi:MAG TPA: N-acyl-D-amino-acid deacylase, partial [Bacteroidales bacterium]|nr:N-acyl-D-amino-acid deacylase [Bacteroidales bacterium]